MKCTFSKAIIILSALGSYFFSATAAEPSGYYSSCEGKNKSALLSALCSKISNHTNVGYDGLWNVYKTSDVHADGTLWDMYSTKNWGTNFSRCGNYKLVGDCVNREHSVPQSWFHEGSPMKSDAFHVYPTDGKVNGQRSNYPYGECSGGTQLPANGSVKPLGRLGTSTFPGYSGRVFEPDDEYKGDFARTYFYMAACYNNSISSWSGDTFNGSDYPVFTTWSKNLFLAWNRQDPVSQKELDRNEAVYAKQHNRNPFIDHPELAEYIWGDKMDQEWSLSATAEPEFLLPVDGSTTRMGTVAVGVARTLKITVKGQNLSDAATATISGTGFTIASSSLSAAAVNAGTAYVNISYTATVAGDATATLALAAGEARSTSYVAATAVNGLPAGPATNVTDCSFMARWVCIDAAGASYTLNVTRADGTSVAGYPRQVNGADEAYEVTDLEAATAYAYTVSNGSLTSAAVNVTTAEPVPSVAFLFDGTLAFQTEVDVPSEVAEILADIENIPGEVTITVSAPFELSTDKAEWSTSIALAPGEERFYMRLYGSQSGTYTTSLLATADGGYHNDDTEVTGIIGTPEPSFVETFESSDPEFTGVTYGDDKIYKGVHEWNVNGVFIQGTGEKDKAHGGSYAIRFGKSSTQTKHIILRADKPNGMGTLTFWASNWKGDAAATYAVSTSSDAGATWKEVARVNIPTTDKTTDYHQYTVDINDPSARRLKIEQTAGERSLLDDLAVTDRVQSSMIDDEAAWYHTWDAYCRGGQLIIECADPTLSFAVYSVDGRQAASPSAKTMPGLSALTLPAGLYIVVASGEAPDFSRRVLIK